MKAKSQAKKTVKKTAKKTAKKASASAKKAAVKKTAKKSGARKATAGPVTGSAATRAVKEKLALLDRMEMLGLLDQNAAADLEKKAAKLEEAADFGKAAGWDRALHGKLHAFIEKGADGPPKKVIQALLTWQEGLHELPPDQAGLAKALASLRRIIPYGGVSLLLRDPDAGRVEAFVKLGIEVELIRRIRFGEGMGFSSWVSTRKQPVLYTSLHRNVAPGDDQVRSFMAVPMVLGGECLGVLNIGHSEDGTYDQASLRVAILAAGMLAGVVQRTLAQRQIQAREISDSDTGFATRRYLASRLQEEVVRCRELGHSMSVMMLRLNELSGYTEQFGAEFESRSRAELAALVKEWRGPTEMVGHGESQTLVMVCPGARREKAVARGEALKALVESHNFPRRKRMTAVVGLATYPADAEDPQELLQCADKMLGRTSQAEPGPGGACQPLAV